jgi:hypothetical protein
MTSFKNEKYWYMLAASGLSTRTSTEFGLSFLEGRYIYIQKQDKHRCFQEHDIYTSMKIAIYIHRKNFLGTSVIFSLPYWASKHHKLIAKTAPQHNRSRWITIIRSYIQIVEYWIPESPKDVESKQTYIIGNIRICPSLQQKLNEVGITSKPRSKH